MQQSVKNKKSFVNLEILIDTINESYCNGRNNELESHIYNTLSVEEMATVINLLQDKYEIKDLLDDLYETEKKDIIMYRILYNLSLRYYIKIASSVKSDKFFIKFFIEQYIVSIFNDLLNLHITSSKGMSESYLNELNRIAKDINFKHSSDENHKINYCMMYFLSHTDNKLFETMMDKYLNDLINKIIEFLSSLTDTELEDDILYAKAIIYQTLLRSILLVGGNIILIDHYRKIYLANQDDSISSSIIKTAFIANYSDRESILKTKTC